MKDLSTEEKNVVIAKFMGHGKITDRVSHTLVEEKLHYHKDWNLLMEVVQKIKKMKNDPKEMFMGTTIERTLAFARVLENYIYAPIELIHIEVFGFIEWYNNQKP